LATEEIRYISYVEAVLLHIELMRLLDESHYGVYDRALVESALARPKHAAEYDGADLLGQAATLCYGLIKNHPWVGGNKRTATALVNEFLYRNDVDLTANTDEIIEMVLAVEGDRWQVQEIDSGLRRNVANSHK
jgi:death-on-curing protein